MATGRPKRPGWRAFNDLATNKTLLELEPEIFVAWFQVMCAAQPHNGMLPMGIAKLYGWSVAKGIRYLARLERAGLIEKHRQTFRVVHWAGAGTPPKTGAERLKRYRDRKKAAVTLPKQIIDAQETLQDSSSNVNSAAPVTLTLHIDGSNVTGATNVTLPEKNSSPQKNQVIENNKEFSSDVTLQNETCNVTDATPVTLQSTENEKTQQNQQLTYSDSHFLDQNSAVLGFSLSHSPSPRLEEVVSNSEEKKEEPIVVVEGRARKTGAELAAEVPGLLGAWKNQIDADKREQVEVTLHAPTKATADETLQAPKGRSKANATPVGFDEAWAAYPGRGQARNPRKTAVASYAKALTVKGATPDLILYGIKAYAEAMRKTGKLDTEFVAMMATWLNQRSWEQYALVISSTASERLRAGAEKPIQKVFVDEGTPAWDAWQTHLRARGKPGSAKTAIMDEKTHLRREGWWFVSSYPPGHQNGKTEGEQGRQAAEVEGEQAGESNVTGSSDGSAGPANEDRSSDDFGATASDEGFGG